MLYALLLIHALQASPSVPVVEAPRAVVGDDVALQLALDSVSPAKLRADLGFLASDELRGRDTPSPELRIAAMFLRSRVERLGFQPGAEDGWLYDYALSSSHLDAENSSLEVSSRLGKGPLVFGEDYYFVLSSHAFDSELLADVMCVGSASKKEMAEVDVEGRWALVLETGRVARSAVKRCQEAGAVGVLLTPGPDYDFEKRKDYAERFGKRASQMVESRTPRLRSEKPKDEAKEEKDKKTRLPQVMVSREAIRRLYALAENPWKGEFPPLGHELGLEVREQRKLTEEEVLVSNVCAFWPGSDPELSKEVMIVSAHYDHVGEKRGEIFNGADDNASGTTGLLAVAEALRTYGPMKRSVMLLWVSGEEKGLWGSKVWTENPWLPEGCRPVLDVNIDMIGRTESDELYITPSRDHGAFNSLAGKAYDLAKLEGFAELESQDEYWRRSDHMNFNDNLEIPVTFLSTGNHPDYHKSTDTAEKIDYEKMSRVVRLVVRLLDGVQGAELER